MASPKAKTKTKTTGGPLGRINIFKSKKNSPLSSQSSINSGSAAATANNLSSSTTSNIDIDSTKPHAHPDNDIHPKGVHVNVNAATSSKGKSRKNKHKSKRFSLGGRRRSKRVTQTLSQTFDDKENEANNYGNSQSDAYANNSKFSRRKRDKEQSSDQYARSTLASTDPLDLTKKARDASQFPTYHDFKRFEMDSQSNHSSRQDLSLDYDSSIDSAALSASMTLSDRSSNAEDDYAEPVDGNAKQSDGNVDASLESFPIHAPSEDFRLTESPFMNNNSTKKTKTKSPKSNKKQKSPNSKETLINGGCNAWGIFCGGDANANANRELDHDENDLDLDQVAQHFQIRVDVHNLPMEEEEEHHPVQQQQPQQPNPDHDFHSRRSPSGPASIQGSLSAASSSLLDTQSTASDEERKKVDLMVLTRSALSRPFGRTSLPAHLAKTYIVEVASMGYDESRGQCVYNILVQMEDYGMNHHHHSKGKGGSPHPSPIRNELSLSTSFVAANVERTLLDFMWLEEALKMEYNGSLLFPVLSLALTSGTDWTTSPDGIFDKDSFERGEWDPATMSTDILDEATLSREPVDTKLIADWLGDVLNAVRGKGELILSHKMVDVIHSEAMETFLYKTVGPLPRPQQRGQSAGDYGANGVNMLNWDFKGLHFQEEDDGDGGLQSTLTGLLKANLKCLGFSPDECDWNKDDLSDSKSPIPVHHSDIILSRRNKIHKRKENPISWQTMIESDSLRSQRFYIAAQKENTLRAMYRLRILLEKEILLSAAWKRFAISLSMLFATEKDIEVSRIGRSKFPLLGLQSLIGRSKVDDQLRILARQKVDRSIPSLKVLSGMLNAYYADFSSVDPSLYEFVEGMKRVQSSEDGEDTWQSQLKAISPLKLLKTNSIPSTVGRVEKSAVRERLNRNQYQMKSSLMQMCKAMKIRVSRMSWKYFKMESGQVSLLLAAAEQAKSNLKYTRSNNPAIVEDEKSDNEREIELVRLIMELALKRRYKYRPLPKSSGASHTSSETSVISENEKSFEGDNETLTTDDGGTIQSPLLENIMSLAKGNSGRWNENLARNLLDASGIPSGVLETDHTSKNVRAVLKLIDSLRESADRCRVAVNMLKEVSQKTEGDAGDADGSLEQLQTSFLNDLSLVFSGACEYGQLNHSQEQMLSNMGIDIYDSAGWLKARQVQGGGKCGKVAFKYQSIRSHGSEEFLARMTTRLQRYDVLIEEFENYLWMHRIGNEMEKHYSNMRADALAAWEKKTDITTAINIATKKRLTLLVKELKEKLVLIGTTVSHSSVKEAKERHLGSKALKSELSALASRRLHRLKESCVENSLSIINEWAIREESAAKVEAKSLAKAIKEIESNVRKNENFIKADGGAHLFAKMANSRTSFGSSSSRSGT